MNDETRKWLEYAEENLASAKVLLDSQLYNPCLQNVQQAIEKLLKACLVESGAKIKKTHSIVELITLLSEMNIHVSLTEDEMDLLDSIYLPSKYPMGSMLSDYEPDQTLSKQCVAIAERVRQSILGIL